MTGAAHSSPPTPLRQRHPAGLVVVVGVHALLVWALAEGLGQKVVEAIRPPLDTRVLPDLQEPPPPPPQPDLPQPRMAAPQQPQIPIPIVPMPPTPIDHGITASHEVAPLTTEWPSSSAGAQPTSPSGSAAAPTLAARPAIADLRACAPTGDDYPPLARRVEATGTTRLRFTVSATGALTRSEVARSAGATREHRLLDKVAQERLSACSFAAGSDASGQPVGGTFEVEYVWRLE